MNRKHKKLGSILAVLLTMSMIGQNSLVYGEVDNSQLDQRAGLTTDSTTGGAGDQEGSGNDLEDNSGSSTDDGSGNGTDNGTESGTDDESGNGSDDGIDNGSGGTGENGTGDNSDKDLDNSSDNSSDNDSDNESDNDSGQDEKALITAAVGQYLYQNENGSYSVDFRAQVTNSGTVAAQGVSIKVLLPEQLQYTAPMAGAESISSFNSPAEVAGYSLEYPHLNLNEVPPEVQQDHSNGQVLMWGSETIEANTSNEYSFTAALDEQAENYQDLNIQWYVDEVSYGTGNWSVQEGLDFGNDSSNDGDVPPDDDGLEPGDNDNNGDGSEGGNVGKPNMVTSISGTSADGLQATLTFAEAVQIPEGAVLEINPVTNETYFDLVKAQTSYQEPTFFAFEIALKDKEGNAVNNIGSPTNIKVKKTDGSSLLTAEGMISEAALFWVGQNSQVQKIQDVSASENSISALDGFSGDLSGVFVLAATSKTTKDYDISAGSPYHNWLEKTTLYYKDGDSYQACYEYTPGTGEFQAVNGGHIFDPKEAIQITVSYQLPGEVNLYPDDQIHYQLFSGGSQVTFGQSDIPLYGDDGTQIGKFNISKEGRIDVSYNSDFLGEQGLGGISTTLTMSGSLNFSNDSGNMQKQQILIGGVPLEINIKPKETRAALSVKKSHGEVRVEEGVLKVPYTLEVIAAKSNNIPLKDIKVQDIIKATNYKHVVQGVITKVSTTQSGLTAELLDTASNKVTTFEFAKNDSDTDIGGTAKFNVKLSSANPAQSDVGFGGTGEEEKIIITYDLWLKQSFLYADITATEENAKQECKNRILNNSIEATAQAEGKEEALKAANTSNLSLSKFWVEKSAHIVKDTDDAGNALIKYAIDINNEAPILDLAGMTITDALTGNQQLYISEGHPFSVAVKNAAGQAVSSPELTISANNGEKSFSIGIPSTGERRYQFHIEYYAKVTNGISEDQAQVENLHNTVTIKDKDDKGVGQHGIPVGYSLYSIDKKYDSNLVDYSKGTIGWKTTLDAYKYQGSGDKPLYDNKIPANSTYTDVVSIGEYAKSHYFDINNLDLTVKDSDGITVPLSDYTYVLRPDQKGNTFILTFSKDLKAPVTIEYISVAGFGDGAGEVEEKYINTGTFEAPGYKGSDADWLIYSTKHLIRKEAKGYDRDRQEFSWDLILNEQQLAVPEKVIIKEYIPEGLTFERVTASEEGVTVKETENSKANLIEIEVSGINRKKVTLSIKTKVADVKELLDPENEVVFVNKAELWMNDRFMDVSTASAAAKFEKLSKEAYYSSTDKTNPYIDYTAYVNEKAEQLEQAQKLIFKDEMNENMSLVANSLHVYDLSSNVNEITSACPLSVNTNSHGFVLDLPNGIPIKITYQVSFREASDAGASVTLKNKAVLYAEKEEVANIENETKITVKEASGSGAGNPNIVLYKSDGEDANKRLGGADFALYQLKNGGDPSNYQDYVRIREKESFTSDNSTGAVNISNITPGTYYYVSEITAPEGYVCNPDLRYAFIFYKKGMDTAQIPKNVFIISTRGGGFYISNNRAQIAIDKVFQDENGKELSSGYYPNGTYYFGVFQNGQLVKVKDHTISEDGEPLLGSIAVMDGRIVNPTASEHALTFEVPISENAYQVYETDESGKKLEAADGTDFVVSGGNKFQTAGGTIAGEDRSHKTDIHVTSDSYPEIVTVTNRLVPEYVKLQGEKEFKNGTLTEDMFQFTLRGPNLKDGSNRVEQLTFGHDKDGNLKIPQIGLDKATVLNGAIDPTVQGQHMIIYTIDEVGGGTSKEGVHYDSTTYTVRIYATYADGQGIKIAKVTINDQEVTPNENGFYELNGTEPAFVNEYKAGEAYVQLKAKKRYNASIPTDTFKFQLFQTNGLEEPVLIDTAAVDSDRGTAQFKQMVYKTEDLGGAVSKDFTYTIKEEIPQGADEQHTYRGITYDLREYTIVVTVTAQGEKLTAQPRLTKMNGNDVNEIVNPTEEDLTFTNTYGAGCALNLKAKKLLEGRELAANEFQFQIRQGDQVVSQGTNDEEGGIVFSQITYDYSEVGQQRTYEYQIEEMSGNLPGISYSNKKYSLQVTVKNIGDGKLFIEKVMLGDREISADEQGTYELFRQEGNTVTGAVFTNTYTAKGEIALEAQKVLIGKDLGENVFQFKLYEADKTENDFSTVGTALETVENKGNHISFTPIAYTLKDLEASQDGRFWYIMKEDDKTTIPGITNDSTEYALGVSVKDAGDGTLEAEVTALYSRKGPEEQWKEGESKEKNITFTNTYKAQGTFRPQATKKLIGTELKDAQFNFQLDSIVLGKEGQWPEDAGEIFAELEGSETSVASYTMKNHGTVTNKGKDIAFEPITYTYDLSDPGKAIDETGKYIYRIKEIVPDKEKQEAGYTYSDTPVYIYVEVTDKGDGTLDVQVYKDDQRNTYDSETALITNVYQANGQLILGGKKNLLGTKLNEDQFSFTLEMAKMQDNVLGEYKQIGEPVKNDGNGSFAFSPVEFTKGGEKDTNELGTYYFRIRESRPSKDEPGYTYLSDGINEYVVKAVVEAADENSDQLKITTKLVDDKGERNYEPDGVVFTNQYSSQGTWTPAAEKTFYGGQLKADQFSFELYREGTSEPIQTVKNNGDGRIVFAPVKFTEKDLRNESTAVINFTVKELIPSSSSAVAGMSFDTAQYQIAVTLKDDGKGNLAATPVITRNNASVGKMTFANSFAGTAEITKTAEDGTTPLAGVKFKLYAKRVNSNVYEVYTKDDQNGIYTTDSSGKLNITGLPANSYYLEETETLPGYVIETDSKGEPVKYSFEIQLPAGAGGTDAAVVDYKTTIKNYKCYGTARLIKTDKQNAGKKLEGAEFTLYKSDGTLVKVKAASDGTYEMDKTGGSDGLTAMTTGADGSITVTNLDWGSYYFQEKTAPEGYLVSDIKSSFIIDNTSFEVNGTGQYAPKIVEITADNQGTVAAIQKLDEAGNPLAEAVLEVKDARTGTVLDTWTSDGTPHQIYGILIPGETYYLSESSAPAGYLIAPDVEFTMPASGRVEVTMNDPAEKEELGEISVTKKAAIVEGLEEKELIAADAVFHVGLFTDPEGKHPYGPDYIQDLHMVKSSVSDTAVYSRLPEGTYYILELNEDGTPLPMDELQDNGGVLFMCTVDGSGNQADIQGSGTGQINLINRYFDFPDGFAYRAYIDISKKVLKGTEEITVEDTFYAGIFTRDEDGVYSEEPYLVTELDQNGTVTVEVPLGGEKGNEPVTYYVFETDEQGNIVDLNEFAYHVTGEGKVVLNGADETGEITITNQLQEEEEEETELTVQKVDESGMPIEGAQFRFVSSESETFSAQWTSGESAETFELEPGTYTLTETAAPGGYVKGDPVTVTVDQDGKISISGKDAKLEGKVLKYVNKKQGSGSPGTAPATPAPSLSSQNNGNSAAVNAIKTGDDTNTLPFMLLLGAAVLTIAGLFLYRRRKEK